jgi:hypothetical protein
VSVTPEPGLLGPQIPLFDHALRLHRENPDAPLPRGGKPFPDEHQHRRKSRLRDPRDWRREGVEAAAVLDEHFARPSASPGDLADAFYDVDVPFHRNEHITAAALRADAQRVHETGRWLVRHATDRCAVIIGLALLAIHFDDEDIPLIQTIGLLSDTFGPLAARAFERRQGGTPALLWLADRTDGWGRVYIVEALCRHGGSAARPWLLRHACNGDYLNGYFAGELATAAHMHEAMTHADPDADLVDHTGRVLMIMTACYGTGTTLDAYPPACIVLEAHAKHTRHLAPTEQRYFVTAQLADYLHQKPTQLAWPPGQRELVLNTYLSLLNRDDWIEIARNRHAADDERFTWLARTAGQRLGLKAFNN